MVSTTTATDALGRRRHGHAQYTGCAWSGGDGSKRRLVACCWTAIGVRWRQSSADLEWVGWVCMGSIVVVGACEVGAGSNVLSSRQWSRRRKRRHDVVHWWLACDSWRDGRQERRLHAAWRLRRPLAGLGLRRRYEDRGGLLRLKARLGIGAEEGCEFFS